MATKSATRKPKVSRPNQLLAILAKRKTGLTVAQIAERLNISKNNAAVVLGRLGDRITATATGKGRTKTYAAA